MNIYDLRFVDNKTEEVFHLKQLGRSESELSSWWTQYLSENTTPYSFVDAKLCEECSIKAVLPEPSYKTENKTTEEKENTTMKYFVKTVYNDPKKQHTIKEEWTTASVDEFMSIMREVLDVPPNDFLPAGFAAYHEKMRNFGMDDDYIASEWDRLLKMATLCQQCFEAIAGTSDNPFPYENEDYVIHVDDDFTAYVRTAENTK